MSEMPVGQPVNDDEPQMRDVAFSVAGGVARDSYKVRVEAGRTYAQLAKRARKSPSSIGAVDKGCKLPTKAMLIAYLHAVKNPDAGLVQRFTVRWEEAFAALGRLQPDLSGRTSKDALVDELHRVFAAHGLTVEVIAERIATTPALARCKGLKLPAPSLPLLRQVLVTRTVELDDQILAWVMVACGGDEGTVLWWQHAYDLLPPPWLGDGVPARPGPSAPAAAPDGIPGPGTQVSPAAVAPPSSADPRAAVLACAAVAIVGVLACVAVREPARVRSRPDAASPAAVASRPRPRRTTTRHIAAATPERPSRRSRTACSATPSRRRPAATSTPTSRPGRRSADPADRQ